MEPLKTNRQCFIWLRILSADESTSRRQKLAHTVFARAVLIGLICGFAASSTFFGSFVFIDLGRSVLSVMTVVAQFTLIYMLLVGFFLLRHKIGTIFDNLKTIHKDSEYLFLSQIKKF